MITNQNTNSNNDDFIISGNWDVLARRMQEKFWQNLEKNLSTQTRNIHDLYINSEENGQTRKTEYFINSTK